MHPWPFKIDKITLLYRVYGYVGFVTWGLLVFLIISWKLNSSKFFKTLGDEPEKRGKQEKVLKFTNYFLYLVIFQLIVSSLDVLLMAIGIFNPARLPLKAIVMASVDIPLYLIVWFSRFMVKSALNRHIAES